MAALLALALALSQTAAPATLTLEIRVFAAGEDVTTDTRVTVHRAGDRTAALPPAGGHAGRHVFSVPAGIYDAQVVRERDGRVVNIRWAERLIVMPYPDEDGRHLEVVNLTAGYGALQVRSAPGTPLPELALFAAGDRARHVAVPVPHGADAAYALFVVPAQRYDLRVRAGDRTAWQADLEVPLERTRLWVIP
jgi:hypothetical protein